MSQTPMFADLDAWNRENPEYFDLPPLDYRQSIPVGRLAQIATADPAHLWLWVEVVDRTPYGYRGVVDCAPPPETGCPVGVGDVVDFAACHVHVVYARVGVGPQPTYRQLLTDAQQLDDRKYWEPVIAWENREIEKHIPPSMLGDAGANRLSEYLKRHPHCEPCEAEGHAAVTATTAFYQLGPEHGEDDNNLMPTCWRSAYIFVARANGWPVRGADINGYPNDPEHPWNAGR